MQQNFCLFLLFQVHNWIELELSQGVNAMSRNPEAATLNRKDLLLDSGRGSGEVDKGRSRSPLTSVSEWRSNRNREENLFSSESGEHSSELDEAGNFHFDGILEREKSKWKGRPTFWVISYSLRRVADGSGMWGNHLRS